MSEAEFCEEVDRTVELYERVGGHPATRTRQMIDRWGCVAALSRIGASAALHKGFKVLRDGGQLDKTFETLVVRYQQVVEFAPGAVDAARWRLKEASKLFQRQP